MEFDQHMSLARPATQLARGSVVFLSEAVGRKQLMGEPRARDETGLVSDAIELVHRGRLSRSQHMMEAGARHGTAVRCITHERGTNATKLPSEENK